MPEVVGVCFKTAGKIYYFSPGDVRDLAVGDYVIVETSRGYEAGRVVLPPQDIPDAKVPGPLSPVLRRATLEDLLSREHYKMKEPEALQRCREKVAEHNLPMKIVGAEYSFDGSSLVFFFTAEKRVDFRELVRDLSRIFRARIELRQIGVRDETKLLGGLGPCGRLLCCITHLRDFRPVSIKMAKQQGLPLSPTEISGLCGRLLCCLAYENDVYQEAQQILPRVGEIVTTIHGRGRVSSVNVIKQSVQVELESGMTVEIAWPPETPAEEPEVPEEEVQPAPPEPEQEPQKRRSRRRKSRRRRGTGGNQPAGTD